MAGTRLRGKKSISNSKVVRLWRHFSRVKQPRDRLTLTNDTHFVQGSRISKRRKGRRESSSRKITKRVSRTLQEEATHLAYKLMRQTSCRSDNERLDKSPFTSKGTVCIFLLKRSQDFTIF